MQVNRLEHLEIGWVRKRRTRYAAVMEITREVFERQCKRRFGSANPERMRVGLWEHMVRHGEDPYHVRRRLGLEPNDHECGEGGACVRADPDWCFVRFGMSRTPMADGWIICIGGEHEDWYDPDFCIYNDVVVLRPAAGKAWVEPGSGEVEIYGYPAGVFPPTDFHSATLVGERIYIIGRLGYKEERRAGETPVYALDTRGYEMAEVRASGTQPGWIYKHHAAYDAARHAITVRGGRIVNPSADATGSEHHAAYRLHLDGMRWEVIRSAERWVRYVLQCEDTGDEFVEPGAGAFRPASVAHTVLLPEERGTMVYGISVDGVRIEFQEFYAEVQVTVEGELPAETVSRVMEEVRGNLERETGRRWEFSEVEGFEGM